MEVAVKRIIVLATEDVPNKDENILIVNNGVYMLKG